MTIQQNDALFLESAFKKYYFNHFDKIFVPSRIKEREFGYQRFNTGMARHIALKDDKELRLLLMNNVPSDVYCSNGYYTFPSLPMAEKDWKAADLIFDIDAKDLNLSCRPSHTCNKCKDCNYVFLNSALCPECNSNKIDSKSFPCSNCINATKQEVEKLLEILTSDFKINDENIFVYFSGNEGFHIHVINSDYQILGSKERAELSDYIRFRGILADTLGMKKIGKIDKKKFPDFGDAGWRGRVATHLFGSKSKRSKIISDIINYDSFQNTLIEIAPKIGAVIDPNVTVDIHRIFRLTGTINSKSGLSKIQCNDNFKKFNPYSDACFIDDAPTEISANCPISFKLQNKTFGPYSDNDKKVMLPQYAAVYLVCKGFATIAS